MSINAIMGNAASALEASQSQLRVVSNNVANVNTPGYVRQVADQNGRVLDGQGSGVTIAQIRRATDRFLAAAAQGANADLAAANAKAELYSQLQASLGDPTASTSLFAQLDSALSGFEAAAADPTSAVARRNALSGLNTFLSSLNAAGTQVQTLRAQADQGVAEGAARVNTLLSQISSLNIDIARARVSGDATGVEGQQSQLIDELSSYLDIKSSPLPNGGLEVRTTDGLLLAGNTASTITYALQSGGAPGQVYPRVQIELDGTGAKVDLESRLSSGSLRGLIDARDRDLPAIGATLGELAGKVAGALNAAHNDATTVPAPKTLTGKTTGLLAGDSLSFSGKTTIAITDPTGTLVRRVDIDFTAGTLSVNGGIGTAIGASVGSFTSAINTALAADGTASFSNGQLIITASGTNGVLTRNDGATPSLRGGQSFGAFFGLNDLIKTSGPSSFATGLSSTDAHGFAVGQQIGFRVLAADGSAATTKTITVAGGSFAGLVAQLNDPVNGLGSYATFSLDAEGRLLQTPTTGGINSKIEVTLDTTLRSGAGGTSFTNLFGVGDAARGARATSIGLNTTISSDATKLSLAQADLSGKSVGDRIVGASDSRGAQALARIGSTRLTFDGAGSLSSAVMTLGDYAARLGGDVAQKASAAANAQEGAITAQAQIATTRSNAEGVNLDEELVKLTTYQQSYNAAARLITAASDLYDTLLGMLR